MDEEEIWWIQDVFSFGKENDFQFGIGWNEYSSTLVSLEVLDRGLANPFQIATSRELISYSLLFLLPSTSSPHSLIFPSSFNPLFFNLSRRLFLVVSNLHS